MKKLFAIMLAIVMLAGCDELMMAPPEQPGQEDFDFPISFRNEDELRAAVAQDPNHRHLQGLTEIYRPGAIPEGYQLKAIDVAYDLAAYVYGNEDDKMLNIVWYKDAPATTGARDGELNSGEDSYEYIERNGIEYLVLRYPDGHIETVWVDRGKFFVSFSNDTSLSIDELLDFCNYNAVMIA